MQLARSELILGGQKSGKSRRAEELARLWLQTPGQRATLIATAQAHDAEMRARIERHQRERAERVPGMGLIEEPRDLAGALAAHSRADTLLVVDCLTLWLTHWLMPLKAGPAPAAAATVQRASAAEFASNRPQTLDWQAQAAHFLKHCSKPPAPSCWWATRSAWASSRWGARCAPSSMPWACSTSALLRPAGVSR